MSRLRRSNPRAQKPRAYARGYRIPALRASIRMRYARHSDLVWTAEPGAGGEAAVGVVPTIAPKGALLIDFREAHRFKERYAHFYKEATRLWDHPTALKRGHPSCSRRGFRSGNPYRLCFPAMWEFLIWTGVPERREEARSHKCHATLRSACRGGRLVQKAVLNSSEPCPRYRQFFHSADSFCSKVPGYRRAPVG